MKIIIEAINTPQVWHHGGTTAELRIYADQDFQTADGQVIPHGNMGSNNTFYLPVICTILGNVLTIPSFEIDSTVDSLSDAYATYSAEIVATNGKRIPYLTNFRVNTLQPGDPSLTWGEIILAIDGFKSASQTDMLVRQLESIISLAAGNLTNASETNKGVTFLTADPVDPTAPKAVGDNDPDWLALRAGVSGGYFNVKSYGAVLDRNGVNGTDDTVAIQAAIDAAAAAGGGTVIIPGQAIVRNTNPNDYCLTIPRSIKLVGVGGSLSGLYMSTDTPTSTSLLRFLPTELPYNEGLTLEDLTLGCAGNVNTGNWTAVPPSGKHLLVLDVSAAPSNTYIRGVTINRCRLLPTSGVVVITSLGANFNGTPAKSRITNSLIYDGISLLAIGDSVLIQSCQFIGENGIAFSTVAGATQIHLADLNYTLKGAIVVNGTAINFKLENSILESVVGTVGSNGAMLDLDGTMTNALIQNNVFGSIGGTSLNGIRVNSSVAGFVIVDSNTGNQPAGKFLLDVTGATGVAFVGWRANTQIGAGGNWTPTSAPRLFLSQFVHSQMPATGVGLLGHISQVGDMRLVGETGRAVTVNLDNRDTALFAQYRFEEAGIQSGAINLIGSLFATADRRNDLELVSVFGDLAFYSGNVRRARFTANGTFTWENGVLWFTGAGSPEGVVIAPVGSMYSRSDGGANTSLYIKESGAGDTGWIGK